jgi:hypothetical protein
MTMTPKEKSGTGVYTIRVLRNLGYALADSAEAEDVFRLDLATMTPEDRRDTETQLKQAAEQIARMLKIMAELPT